MNMTFRKWGVVGAIALGSYGAGVSTLALINQRRHQRIHVRPDLFQETHTGTSTSSSPSILLRAQNDGTKTVILTDFGLLIPDKSRDREKNLRISLSKFANRQQQFSYELQPGSFFDISTNPREVFTSFRELGLRGTVRVECYFADQCGNCWSGGNCLILDFDNQTGVI